MQILGCYTGRARSCGGKATVGERGRAGLWPEREGEEWPPGARPALEAGRRVGPVGENGPRAEAGQPGRKESGGRGIHFLFSNFSKIISKSILNAKSIQLGI